MQQKATGLEVAPRYKYIFYNVIHYNSVFNFILFEIYPKEDCLKVLLLKMFQLILVFSITLSNISNIYLHWPPTAHVSLTQPTMFFCYCLTLKAVTGTTVLKPNEASANAAEAMETDSITDVEYLSTSWIFSLSFCLKGSII